MALTRDDFDYVGYLKYNGIADEEIPNVEEMSDEFKNRLYERSMAETLQYYRGQAKNNPYLFDDNDKEDWVKSRFMDTYDEGRQMLGIPAAVSDEDLFSIDDFDYFTRTNDLGDDLATNLRAFARTRVGNKKNAKYINPALEGMEVSEYEKAFKAKNGFDEWTTMQDVWDRKIGPEAMVQAEEATKEHDSSWGYSVDVAQKMLGKGFQTWGESISKHIDEDAGNALRRFGEAFARRQDEDIRKGGYEQYGRKYKEELSDYWEKGDAAGFAGKVWESFKENAASTGLILGTFLLPGGAVGKGIGYAGGFLAGGLGRLPGVINAATKAGGIIGKVGQGATGVGMGMALETGDARESLEDAGVYYDENNKAIRSDIVTFLGALNAFADYATGGLVLGKLGTRSLRKYFGSEATKKLLTQAAKDEAKAAFEKEVKRTLKNRAFGAIGVVLGDQGVEFAQEVDSMMLANYLKDKELWSEKTFYSGKDLLNAGLVAALASSFFSGPSVAGRMLTHNMQKAKARVALDKINAAEAAASGATGASGASGTAAPSGGLFDPSSSLSFYRAGEDDFSVSDGFFVGHGTTREGALANLYDVTNPASKIRLDAAMAQNIGGVYTLGLGNKGHELRVSGPNAENVLRQAVELHNANDNTINFDGAIESIEIDTDKIGSDLERALAEKLYGDTVHFSSEGVRGARNVAEFEISTIVAPPNNRSGNNIGIVDTASVDRALRAKGYIPVQFTNAEKDGEAIVQNGFRALRDGILYEVKLHNGHADGKTATVKALDITRRDRDGNFLNVTDLLDPDIRSQRVSAVTDPVAPASETATLRLAPPALGIEVRRQEMDGRQTFHFNDKHAAELAKTLLGVTDATDAKILESSASRISLQLQDGGDIIDFRLTGDGRVLVSSKNRELGNVLVVPAGLDKNTEQYTDVNNRQNPNIDRLLIQSPYFGNGVEGGRTLSADQVPGYGEIFPDKNVQAFVYADGKYHALIVNGNGVETEVLDEDRARWIERVYASTRITEFDQIEPVYKDQFPDGQFVRVYADDTYDSYGNSVADVSEATFYSADMVSKSGSLPAGESFRPVYVIFGKGNERIFVADSYIGDTSADADARQANAKNMAVEAARANGAAIEVKNQSWSIPDFVDIGDGTVVRYDTRVQAEKVMDDFFNDLLQTYRDALNVPGSAADNAVLEQRNAVQDRISVIKTKLSGLQALQHAGQVASQNFQDFLTDLQDSLAELAVLMNSFKAPEQEVLDRTQTTTTNILDDIARIEETPGDLRLVVRHLKGLFDGLGKEIAELQKKNAGSNAREKEIRDSETARNEREKQEGELKKYRGREVSRTAAEAQRNAEKITRTAELKAAKNAVSKAEKALQKAEGIGINPRWSEEARKNKEANKARKITDAQGALEDAKKKKDAVEQELARIEKDLQDIDSERLRDILAEQEAERLKNEAEQQIPKSVRNITPANKQSETDALNKGVLANNAMITLLRQQQNTYAIILNLLRMGSFDATAVGEYAKVLVERMRALEERTGNNEATKGFVDELDKSSRDLSEQIAEQNKAVFGLVNEASLGLTQQVTYPTAQERLQAAIDRYRALSYAYNRNRATIFQSFFDGQNAPVLQGFPTLNAAQTNWKDENVRKYWLDKANELANIHNTYVQRANKKSVVRDIVNNTVRNRDLQIIAEKVLGKMGQVLYSANPFAERVTRKVSILDELLNGKVFAKSVENLLRHNRLVIVDSQEQLLDMLSLDDEELYDPNKILAQGTVLADGRIVLVGDAIADGKAPGVLLHELGVHARRFGLNDSEFKAILDSIRHHKDDETEDGKIVKAAIARAKTAGLTEENPVFWEEVAAYIVEDNANVKSSLLDSIISWFRKALFRMGFIEADRLTPKDLVNFARGAAKSSDSMGIKVRNGVALFNNAAFSLVDENSELYKWLEQQETEVKNNPRKVRSARFSMSAPSTPKMTAVEGAPGVYRVETAPGKNNQFKISPNDLPQGQEQEAIAWAMVDASNAAKNLHDINDLRNKLGETKYEKYREGLEQKAQERGWTGENAIIAVLAEEVLEGKAPRAIIEELHQDVKDTLHRVFAIAWGANPDNIRISPQQALAASRAIAGVKMVYLEIDVPNRDVATLHTTPGKTFTDRLDEQSVAQLDALTDQYQYTFDNQGNTVIVNDTEQVIIRGTEGSDEQAKSAIDKSVAYMMDGVDGGGFYNDSSRLLSGRDYGDLEQTSPSAEQVYNILGKFLRVDILDKVQIYHTETQAAKNIMQGNAGIFLPRTLSRKMIHIMGWGGTTLGQILQRVGHEVSHFGWQMWASPELENAVANIYDAFEDQIRAAIPEYFEKAGFPNASRHGKVVPKEFKCYFVNEFFAINNQSLLDGTVSDKAEAMGIDAARYTELHNELAGHIAKLKVEIADAVGGHNLEWAKAFADDILQLTMGTTIGKGVNFVYQVPRTGGDTATVHIFTNDYGQVRTVVPDNRMAGVAHEIEKVHEILTRDGSAWGKVMWFFVRGLYRNLPLPLLGVAGSRFGDSIIGQTAQLMISSGFNSILTPTMARENKESYEIMEVANNILRQNGYDPEIVGTLATDNYEHAFRQLGLTGNKQIAYAKAADHAVAVAQRAKFNNAVEIRRQIRLTIRSLEEYMRADVARSNNPEPQEVTEKRIQKMREHLEEIASHYHTEWTHRRYEAYSDNGIAELRRMRADITRNPADGPTISERAAQARRHIDVMDAQRQSGAISWKEYYKATQVDRAILHRKERLDALKALASIKAKQNNVLGGGIADNARRVNKMMQDIIDDTIKESNNFISRKVITTNNLMSIDSVHERKLDMRYEADRLYAEFLGQIKNPLENLVYSVNEQQKIIEKYAFNREFGSYLLEAGMANLRGSRDASKAESTLLGMLNSGTFLQYISVKPLFMEEIQNEYELNTKLREKAWWNYLTNSIKANNTVLNPRLMVSNFIGNIGLLVGGGHFFSILKWKKAAKIAIREYVSRYGTSNIPLDELEKQIVREMREMYVIGNTAAEIQMQETRNNAQEKMVHCLFSLMKGSADTPNYTIDWIEKRVDKLFDMLRHTYAYGDEWLKPLVYMNNKAVAIAHQRTVLSRGNYDSEEAYNEAVNKAAKEEAAYMTTMETTSWPLSPNLTRELSRGGMRLLAPDFLQHNFQMLRITSFQVVRWKQIMREMTNLAAKGNARTAEENAYYDELRREYVRRTIGVAMTGAALAGAMGFFNGGVLATTPYVINAIGALFGKDDDDDDKEKKSNRLKIAAGNLSSREYMGMQQTMNYLTGANLSVPLARKDGRIWGINYPRNNVMWTSLPIHPASNSPTWQEWGAQWLFNNVVPYSRTGTITMENVNNIMGKDRYGNEIGLEKGAANVVLRAFMPGIATQAYGLFAVPPWQQERQSHDSRLERALELTGFMVNHWDDKRLYSRIARDIKNATGNENYIRKDFLKALRENPELDERAIASMLNKMRDENRKNMNRFTYALDGLGMWSKLGRSQAIRYMVKDVDGRSTGLSQKAAKGIVQGRNILDEALLTSLANERKKMVEYGGEGKLTKQERDRVVKNYATAMRMLQQSLRQGDTK